MLPNEIVCPLAVDQRMVQVWAAKSALIDEVALLIEIGASPFWSSKASMK
jgi:hypothetical protein